MADQFLVRAGAERAAPLGFRPLLDGDGPLMPLKVHRGSGQAPEAADACQTVALTGGGEDGLAYGLRLLGAKGQSTRQRCNRSSLSIVSSPTFALRTYPSRPEHRYVMKAHTRWSIPK